MATGLLTFRGSNRVGPFTEIGDTGLLQFSGHVVEEFLARLRGREAMKIYREMSENDPIIGACHKATVDLCQRATWRVEGQDDERKEFLETIPDDMSKSWNDFIDDALSMLIFGWSYFELVYKKRNGPNRLPGQGSKFNDGLIGVRKIAGRSQESIDRWLFDDEGGIQAYVQRPDTTGQEIILPIHKGLLFRTTTRKNNPEGKSALRTSYRTWLLKKRVEEVEGIGIERDTAGIPVALVPPEILHESASAADKDILEQIKKIVKNIKVDEQMGVVFPLAYDEQNNKIYDLTLLNTAGQKQFNTSDVIERYSRHMAMTMLADVIMMGHEKVGSFALASSKTNLFSVSLGTFLDHIEDVLNRHLVPRLMNLNGFSMEEMPEFKHGDIETMDLQELGDYIDKLAGAGFPLFPTKDNVLERFLLEQAGLPVPAEGEDIVDEEKMLEDQERKMEMQRSIMGGGNDDESQEDDEEEEQVKGGSK